MTEAEMVEWHHQLNGHESEQVLGVGDGQGSLACRSPWSCKESDTTEQLNLLRLSNSQAVSASTIPHYLKGCDSQVRTWEFLGWPLRASGILPSGKSWLILETCPYHSSSSATFYTFLCLEDLES